MDSQNNLWIGTTAYNSVESLVKFDGTSFTIYNSLNSPLPENDGILDLKTDQRGNLWIALKRIGLPDHLQNIKIALYNSSGVNLVSDVFLQNISCCREPISKNISTLFHDRIQFQINLEGIKPFTKIEFLINDKVIHYVERESILKNNGEINFTYYLSKPDKYPIKVYLYDTIGIKTEMANVELNLQFNRSGFFLGQNEPNPIKDYTVIEYGFFEGRIVELKIFDQYLRQVGSVSERIVTWIGKPYIFQTKNAANGCYYYYLKENYTGIISSKKMILFNPERFISLPH